ncbi:hypothetical protein [Leuconostoc palmae]|uniref:hypothetical protein n=1 Tax=Leuconostoc palmae TaxID=501487 RepID=UPI001C7D0DA4|nr:hypothetical protein [Leuconostoc palmae]
MNLLRRKFSQVLHHPNTLVVTILSTMVMIMLSYNTIIRYGISLSVILTIVKVYPAAVIFIYYLRRFVTLPLVLRLHDFYPNIFSKMAPRHVTIPFLVIAGNVSVMMVILTETHRSLYPLFLQGYIDNWFKTFLVAVPLFFFIVRPLIILIFDQLKTIFPLVDDLS